MRKFVAVFSMVMAMTFVVSGLSFAKNENKEHKDHPRNTQMEKRNSDRQDDFSDSEFFKNNLISLDRFTNQEINISDDRNMDLVDFLVDPNTGDVEYMIISSEGWLGLDEEQYVLPYKNLTINQQERMLSVDESDVTIGEKTLYTPKTRGQLGVNDLDDDNEMNEQKDQQKDMDQKDDSMNRTDQRDYTGHGKVGLVEASRLYNREVYGADDNQIGELSAILVDTEAGKIKMVVLEHGAIFGLLGDQYLIPWQAVNFDSQQKRIYLQVTEDNLENYSKASEYEDWDGSTLSKDTAAKMHKQYDYEYEAN